MVAGGLGQVIASPADLIKVINNTGFHLVLVRVNIALQLKNVT